MVKRPTEAQLEQALAAAKRMLEHGIDPHYVAHTLLYLQARNRRLEEVLRRTDRYLRFGMAERELSQLRQLVDRMREELDSDAPLESDTSMLL